MYPSTVLANGEQLIYATAYGSSNNLEKAIASVVSNRMNVLNDAELVDVQVVGLSGATPQQDQPGVLLVLRTRRKATQPLPLAVDGAPVVTEDNI
ncbi:hypothetical protein GCM10008957_50330 [Deinococcus ruber]|uniref:Uncharacterized protein n=1 Tax=Deinococcus ruber TaxID=1848197 RepID=A0A918CPJ6_9DEIO|nr:hypothetical protein GCM10008957_50330 [Deinococcus ruber]